MGPCPEAHRPNAVISCVREDSSESTPLLLSFYVGIMQAKMAAIAGTRPSITTNAIIIETIAAIFF